MTEAGHARLEPQVIMLEMYYQQVKNYNYLVLDPCTHLAVLVDPAWQMEKIDSALLRAGARLRGVLLTHSHPDHIDLAEAVAEKHRCPIWMSREEIAASGFSARQLVAIGTLPWYVGSMEIRPLFTPGHTPGGMCYLIGDNLFTGDTLFAEGCGLCPDVAGAHAMFASLNRLKGMLGPTTRIFPGHSYGKAPGQPFSQVLQDNIYLQIPNKETFAAFRLRKRPRDFNLFGQ
jgi:glyoxylase-like metal-dependent hydrolase (beta-lactamase superfamily II)